MVLKFIIIYPSTHLLFILIRVNNDISCVGNVEREVTVIMDYDKLGKRISNLRSRKGLSQEELGEKLNLSREYVSFVETNKRKPSVTVLVDIANTLGVSTDDLLVDSLEYSTSTADSEIHRLLLDCNPIEEEILTRTVKELKAILYANGI